jgi:hypothetical protein
MQSGRRALVVSALAVAIGLASGVASATTMRQASVEELARASDAVVLGRVAWVDARLEAIAGRRGIYTHVGLEVSEWLKGRGDATVELVVHGGRVGADVARVHGQARFHPGEEVVVFLFEGGGVRWPTAMSQGKWRVSRTVDGVRVASAAEASALVAPPGAVPAAPEMSLDELRRRVGAR